MAEFHLKTFRNFIINCSVQQVINGPVGPQVVTTPTKAFKLKPGRNIVTDPEQIERVRRSRSFGTAELFEITQEDKDAINIHNKKQKEADVEIAEKKKSKAIKK